jgi:hypothetical protein
MKYELNKSQKKLVLIINALVLKLQFYYEGILYLRPVDVLYRFVGGALGNVTSAQLSCWLFESHQYMYSFIQNLQYK